MRNGVITIGGINVTVRVKNIAFWIPIVTSIIVLWGAKLGININELHTYTSVWEFIVNAVADPTIILATLGIIWNAIIDPTTKGLTDSTLAIDYDTPK